MLHALFLALLSAAPPAPPTTPEPLSPTEQSVVLERLPPAAGRADLLLVLERPKVAEPPTAEPLGEELKVAVYHAEGKRLPDLLLPTAESFIVAFYDLPAGPQRLAAGAPELYLADRMLELRAGETHHLKLGLARRPDVRVRIDLPESERRFGKLNLEMRSLSPPGSLAPWKLEADAEEALLEKVLPVDSEFTLRSGPWTFRSPLDLRRGRNGELRFDPDETNLHGYLSAGGRPATGVVHFALPDQKGIAVKTDGRGWYDAFLWRRGLYVIGVEFGNNETYRFYYELQEVARKVLDIDVPTARYQVRAIDRATGRSVPLKKATYAFRDEEDRLLEGDLKLAGGRALLPPLGVGKLDLFLVAEGYVERQWKGFELSPQGRGDTLVAELDPIEEWVNLRLEKESGEPIKGAQVRVLRDGFSDQILWEGRSGELGGLRVPGQYRGMPVLVRAAGFGFHADLLPEPTPDEVPWQLEKSGLGKTSLVVVDEESRTVAGAEVALRVGPVWLRGEALAWLVGSAHRGPRTDGDGVMMLRDLPPRKMLVLARVGSFDPDEVVGLAYHATPLESPAPPILVVRVSPE